MSRFVYVTYIRTTAAKLWQALTEPEFTRLYWFGATQESEWTKGSPWKMFMPEIGLTDAGEVLEVEPEKRLVLSWRNEFRPELREEGFSRMTYELEQRGDVVKFTVIHEIDKDEAKLIGAVSNGWPAILANLKTLLETGEPIGPSRDWFG